ncbi:MFS family permease [Inhella inkyongensis]|uniref:MFS family permease n=1 Tax=Inhella inkyongensis TaxID=392593 RepID=A0A840S3L7_9BURK|nr:MFS transporter [Inhella inkyongensis]MBB5204935.1 MFS family permease [Inhella inkyongensis]
MKSPTDRLPWPLLLCAAAVMGMALGTRHAQGLFMLPLLGERGWGRETFALAQGLQTLVWGALQPLTGWLADRYGAARVIATGCVVYAAGLLLEATATSPAHLALGAGLLTGLGLTATTFATIYSALSRAVEPAQRGAALGWAGGLAGFFQFLLVPLAHSGIAAWGWSAALQALAAMALGCALAGMQVRDRPGEAATLDQSLGALLRTALTQRDFWLLNAGFMACGFQLAFLGVHLPAYLRDAGLGPQAGVHAMALIALANAIGIYYAGRLGERYRRSHLLSALYALRSLAMLLFISLPLSLSTLYVFAWVMGLTWLGTVPLTSGVLAQLFGVRYLGTMFGLVFLGHQLGGFLGAWLGGRLFDVSGSYTAMWAIAIGLGVVSSLLHLPIRDRTVGLGAQPA